MTTIGKYRHLSRCSTDEGHFCILAIDHRTNLLDKLNQHAPEPLTDAQFTSFKQAVVGGLVSEASAVLMDPAYGIGAAVAERRLGAKGLLAPVEVTDYDLHPSRRKVNFIPGWSVEKIKRVGGDGVKLLLPYHPEASNRHENHQIVAQLVEQCGEQDIPFFLEPIAFSLDPDRKLDNAELRQIVVEMAQTFSAMGVDVLKLEFPLDANQSRDEEEWRAACEAVDLACMVPWALLSAGVDYETFKAQARVACEAGASGVIVGRAVWAEAVELQGELRTDFIRTNALQRMHELANLCETFAQPWYERVQPPRLNLDWYQSY